MRIIPQLLVNSDGHLLDKVYFPNQWTQLLNLETGQAIPSDLYDITIRNYSKEDFAPIDFILDDVKIQLRVEPSAQNFHISFERMSDNSISGRKDRLNRYQLLVEAASDVIFEIDLDGRFTYMNQAAVKMSGFSEKEIIGKPFTMLVREDWQHRVTDFYLKQIQKAEKNTYLEFPGVNKNGEVTWLGQKVQLLEDKEGMVGLMAVARNITERVEAEELLRKSEEKYRGMLKGLQFGLLEVDMNERIVFVNDPMCEITGYTREELIGQVGADILVDGEYRDKINRETGSRKKGVASVYEVKIRHKNGEALWALISGAPLYDVEGNQIGSIGIHMDITAKKQEEFIQREMSKKLSSRNHELRKKQNFLNGLNHFVTKLLEEETIDEIAWEIAENVIDKFGFEDCVIYVLNKSKGCLEQIAAYGPGKAKDRTVLDPIEIQFGHGIVGSVAQSGIPEMIGDTSQDPRYVVDDVPRLSELTVPILSDGEVIGVIDSEHPEANFYTQEHLDTLTTLANLASNRLRNAKAKRNQLKAEQETRDSERKLRTILESALDAVVTINDKGIITEWNRQAEVMFGFSQEEIIGKSLTETIIPEEFRIAHDRGMAHYLNTGEGPVLNQKIEIAALRKNGEQFPIELAIVPVVMKGVHTFTAFISDITVQKQVQQEMEKALSKERELNELKSRFVAMTSHEFRTPLTTIKQNIDLVGFKLENQLPEAFPSYQKHLNRIESEIMRVTSLMNDILMLGRIESGKMEVRKKPGDLKAFCERIVEQHSSAQVDRNVKLSVTGVPQPVAMDNQLFDHVMQNLISNALKYSVGKQDPEVTLRYQKLDHVSIHVKDYGIGIPKKDQKGLFQTFYRATNVQNIQGSGLGLSIVKEFVELHGGTINVVSEKDAGSEFIVEVPYQ